MRADTMRFNPGEKSQVGLSLDLNPCEEKQLADFLKNYQENYLWPLRACQTPIQKGLEKLGYELGWNGFPVSLGNSFIDSGLVGNYEIHEQSAENEGVSAPWAK